MVKALAAARGRGEGERVRGCGRGHFLETGERARMRIEMRIFLQKAIEPISWRLMPTVHLIPMKTSKVESALGKNLLCKVSQDYLYKGF